MDLAGAALLARHMGIATATPIMLRALGGAIGVALLGELLRQRAAVVHDRATALASVWACGVLVCLLAAAATRWLPRALPPLEAPGQPQAPPAVPPVTSAA